MHHNLQQQVLRMRVCEAARVVTEDNYILTNAQFVSRRTDYESTRLEGEREWERERERKQITLYITPIS